MPVKRNSCQTFPFTPLSKNEVERDHHEKDHFDVIALLTVAEFPIIATIRTKKYRS
jgi:hypothetical protein